MNTTLRNLVLLPLLAAAGSAPCQPAEPQFSLTISSQDVNVKAGSSVRITISLRNTSGHDQPISWAHGAPEATFDISVVESGGRPAAKTRSHSEARGEGPNAGGGAISWVIGSLKPGAELNEQTMIERLYDISKPGNYIVRATYRNGRAAPIAQSNSITLTVKP
jgi:hypothetical protein